MGKLIILGKRLRDVAEELCGYHDHAWDIVDCQGIGVTMYFSNSLTLTKAAQHNSRKKTKHNFQSY